METGSKRNPTRRPAQPDRYDLRRLCNFIDQTILEIVALDKLVVHICAGHTKHKK